MFTNQLVFRICDMGFPVGLGLNLISSRQGGELHFRTVRSGNSNRG